MSGLFSNIANRISRGMGSPWAFIIAVTVIIIWAAAGPLFKFSDTWQLVVNTSTTIITFLMVFLIQNTQNRDSEAMLIKLDELIRSQTGARNKFMNIEKLSDGELDKLHKSLSIIQHKRASVNSKATPSKRKK